MNMSEQEINKRIANVERRMNTLIDEMDERGYVPFDGTLAEATEGDRLSKIYDSLLDERDYLLGELTKIK